jgi:hypothetical protein
MAIKDARLISGADLYYGSGDGTAVVPTAISWVKLENLIINIPELFSKPDTVDTTTINNTNLTNIPGLSGGDSLDFETLVNDAMYSAYALMLVMSNTPATKGLWFKLVFDDPGRDIIWGATIPTNLIISGGAGADLNKGILATYPTTDLTDTATS